MEIIENGKITSAMLGFEGHGILSSMIMIEFDGSGQGFGGWGMDSYSKEKDCRVGTAFGCQYIMDVLKTLELEQWDDLKGQIVRVKREESFGKIKAIGHAVKNKWFDPEKLVESMGLK